jgi:hypothetical protein
LEQQQAVQISSLENSTSSSLKQVASKYFSSIKASQSFGYIAASKYQKNI